jgi:hypothetical protein
VPATRFKALDKKPDPTTAKGDTLAKNRSLVATDLCSCRTLFVGQAVQLSWGPDCKFLREFSSGLSCPETNINKEKKTSCDGSIIRRRRPSQGIRSNRPT